MPLPRDVEHESSRPKYFDNAQIDRKPETLDQFFRSVTPNTGPSDACVISEAMSALFARIGPETIAAADVEPLRLKPRAPYPENSGAIVAQVQRENETDYLPPLATRIENIRQCDTVFVGFPTWACACRRR